MPPVVAFEWAVYVSNADLMFDRRRWGVSGLVSRFVTRERFCCCIVSVYRVVTVISCEFRRQGSCSKPVEGKREATWDVNDG